MTSHDAQRLLYDKIRQIQSNIGSRDNLAFRLRILYQNSNHAINLRTEKRSRFEKDVSVGRIRTARSIDRIFQRDI